MPSDINIDAPNITIDFVDDQVTIDFTSPVIAVNFSNDTAAIDFADEQITIDFEGGPPGPPGADGADGIGVPPGGSAGQVLTKLDGTDYNTTWSTPAGGGGAVTITVTAGEAITAGDLVYIAVDGLAYKADATDATKEAVLICPDAILIGDTGTANPTGAVLDVYAALSPGYRYFLSATTPGTFDMSIPSAAGEIVQQVGHALTTSAFYFCPTVSILVAASAETFNRLTENGDTRITEAGDTRVIE